MPRLTVLLPVRDGGAFLRAAVRSTLRSMPRDAELLVGDDGSRDTTQEVLASASGDRRLQVVRSEQSRGVARTLNHLLHASDSQYVARMDADDVSLPWRFLRLSHQMQSADFLFAPVINVDARLKPVSPDLPGPISPAALPLHLLVGNVLRHPTMVATRNALQDLDGYRDDTAAEDYDLWMRAAAAGYRMRRRAAPVLLYREHGGQVTRSASWNSAAERGHFSSVYADVYRTSVGTGEETAQYATSALAGDPGGMDEPHRLALRHRLLTAARKLPASDRALLRLRLRALA